MTKEIQNQFLKEEYISRINRVVNYIDSNLDKEFNLDVLAGIAHFSPFHFHRVFSSIIGESPNRYITRKRLENAAVQLRFKPKNTITRIAYECGFNSSASFSRAFRNHYKMSPREWRVKEANNEIKEFFDDVKPERVDIKKLSDMTVAYIMHTGLNSDNENNLIVLNLIDKLNKWAFLNNVQNTSKTKLMIIGHDVAGITDYSKCRISLAITIPEDTEVSGEVSKMLIPGRKYAIGHFFVKMHEHMKAWNYMLHWVSENNYQLDPVNCIDSLEIYHYIPLITEDNIVVDLCLPVK